MNASSRVSLHIITFWKASPTLFHFGWLLLEVVAVLPVVGETVENTVDVGNCLHAIIYHSTQSCIYLPLLCVTCLYLECNVVCSRCCQFDILSIHQYNVGHASNNAVICMYLLYSIVYCSKSYPLMLVDNSLLFLHYAAMRMCVVLLMAVLMVWILSEPYSGTLIGSCIKTGQIVSPVRISATRYYCSNSIAV